MILIAAADQNWALGKEGDLLAKLSQDMKFFRTKTTGNIVIMGRKTLESFPKKQPLPNRTNVVLTQNKTFVCENTIICHSVEETLQTLHGLTGKTAYIIGGGSIYKQFLPYCQTAYITKFHTTFPADTWLCNLDTDPHWEKIEESSSMEEKGISFSFVTYQRISS